MEQRFFQSRHAVNFVYDFMFGLLAEGLRFSTTVYTAAETITA